DAHDRGTDAAPGARSEGAPEAGSGARRPHPGITVRTAGIPTLSVRRRRGRGAVKLAPLCRHSRREGWAMQPRHVSRVVFLCLTLAWGLHSLSAQVPAPRREGAPLSWRRAEAEQAARNPSADAVAGELRIVDSHRYNFMTIVYNVFEHLMDLDKD